MTAKKEGLKDLRASVIPLTDDEVSIWQLAENRARKSLTHSEQSKAVLANYKTIGYNREDALLALRYLEYKSYPNNKDQLSKLVGKHNSIYSRGKELATREFCNLEESIGMSATHQANLLEYARVEPETQKHIETA